MKDLQKYKNLKYRMIIEYSHEDESYFVKFPDLPGCIADGETAEKAVKNALAVKNEWLKVALESGWTIPEPAAVSDMSGRVTLRLPKSIHERLIDRAGMEGVSLNQQILTYVISGLEKSEAQTTIMQLQQEVLSQLNQIKDAVNTDNEFKTGQMFPLPSLSPSWNYPHSGTWAEIQAGKQNRDLAREDNQVSCYRGMQ